VTANIGHFQFDYVAHVFFPVRVRFR
jgi:hypothetical protein